MRHFAPALALCMALTTPAFAQETDAPTSGDAAYDASTVVARVNDKEITIGHMIALMERLPEQYRQLPDAQLFPGILDQLIDQVMIADSVSKSPETDARRVQLILQNERWALLAKIAVDEMVAQGVPEDALQAAYDARYANFEAKTEYDASHILVETAEAAQEVIAMIEGGADFAEVAKEKSTGPSGPNGGALGWFGEGVMVPPFEAAVVAMETGAISEPVQTQFGWHVIKLNETREIPAPTLDEVREELTNEILQTQVQEKLDEMRAGATIEQVEIEIPQSVIREGALLDEAN